MNKKNIKRAYNVAVTAVLLLIVAYVCSRFMHPGVEYTDDAQVCRHITPVNTRVQGFVKEIRFSEYQHVKQGDTLVVIDDAEYRLQLAQAEAGLRGSQSGKSAVNASLSTISSHVDAAAAGVDMATAGTEEAKVAMDNAKRDLDRFEALIGKGAVTQQQYDHAKTVYEQAKSRYEAALARMNQATASKQSTTLARSEQKYRLGQSAAGTSVAEAQLNLARLNLSYTVITSPCDGIMDKETIHEGQLTFPGQQLCRVIDDNDVWVTANYRETQMRHIDVGSKVTFTADALPGITYSGEVESIAGATGSATSHIQTDNATGNFVKVEQRIPVRIKLTGSNKPQDIKKLKAGFNVETEIDY